jgi:hypothetical protein
MAITSVQVAKGILAAAIVPTAVLQRVSTSSDSFESRVGDTPEHANYLVLSVLVEKIANLSGTEDLAVDLFQSKDKSVWNHVAELRGSSAGSMITSVGLHEIVYAYSTDPNNPTLAYFRLQFSVDDSSAVGNAVPYPAPPPGIQFDGVCWAAVGHK